MISARELVLGLVVPAISAALPMLILRLAGKRVGPAVATTAFACGWIAGQTTIEAVRIASARISASEAATEAIGKFLHPTLAREWLPLIVLLAANVEVFAHEAGPRLRTAIVVARAVICGFIPARLLWTSVYCTSRWSGAEQAIGLASLSLMLLVLWTWASRPPAASYPKLQTGSTCFVLFALAVTLFTVGGRIYGQLALVLAVVAATLAISAGRQRSIVVSITARTGIVVAASLVLLGHFFAALPAATAIFFALALAVVSGPLPSPGSKSRRRCAALVFAASVVLGASFATHATMRFLKAVETKSANPYYGRLQRSRISCPRTPVLLPNELPACRGDVASERVADRYDQPCSAKLPGERIASLAVRSA